MSVSFRGDSLSTDQDAVGELIARSARAALYRQPDGSVLKQYLTDNAAVRVQRDQQSMEYLRDHFGEVAHEGWSFRTTRPLGFDAEAGTVRMEHVSGRPLSAFPGAKMPECEYLCGVWLALYHNKLLSEEREGMVYSDFNVHNVLIDPEEKSVVVIDPGMEWGRLGHAYEDLVHHIHCVAAVLVVRGKAPLSAPLGFLRGYRQVSDGKLRLRPYYKALMRELIRRFGALRRRSIQRGFLFLCLSTALAPLYLFVVPAYLWSPRGQ